MIHSANTTSGQEGYGENRFGVHGNLLGDLYSAVFDHGLWVEVFSGMAWNG